MNYSKLILFVFLNLTFLNSFKLFAEKPEGIDEIEKKIKECKEDTLKVDLLIKKASLLTSVNLDLSIDYYISAIKLARKTENKSLIIRTYDYIVQNFYYLSYIPSAIDYYFEFIQLADEKGWHNEKKLLHNTYGNILCINKEYAQSVPYYFSALEYAKFSANKYLETKIYMNLGVVYFHLNILDSSDFYVKKSLEYASQEKFDKIISNLYAQKGENEFARGDYLEAIRTVHKILARQQNDNYQIANAHLLKGKSYLKLGKRDSAYYNLKKSITWCNVHYMHPLLIEATEYLYTDYKSNSNYDSAFKYYELNNIYSDSVKTRQNEISIASGLMRHEIVRKNIELRNKEEQVESEKRKKLYLYFVIFGFLLSFYLAFKAYLQKRKDNREIEKQKKLVEEKQKEVLDSIHYAKRIQDNLLANKELANQFIPDSFLIFEPKDVVSGDFYWAAKKADLFYFAVCDCTGHGVPGAFMSLLNINYLNEAINKENLTEPNSIFDYVRSKLKESFSQDSRQDGMDGTLICINKSKKTITYTAAHNRPIFVRGSELIEGSCDKMHVGIGYNEKPFEQFSYQYEPGDHVYLFTDGYADQFGGQDGKKLKLKKFKSILLENANFSIEEQKKHIFNSFTTWKRNLEQVDDVCVVGIKL